MNAEDTRTIPPDGEFDPHRLRSITDMKRSRDDRLVAGVCSGAARYLDIDPVIVRVVIAVLTVVGFAGPILYVAAWFLLPVEGEERSIAADWFKLDKNEEQVRVAGLVGAVVLAAVAVVGDNGWFWNGAPWILVPIGLVWYVFVVRPRRRAGSGAPETGTQPVHTPTDTAHLGGAGTPGANLAPPLVGPSVGRPRRRSWALTGLTLSVATIAVALLLIWSEYHDQPTWTTYVAMTLGIVGVGLLVSTFFGDAGPLLWLGALLALVLTAGSLVPNGRVGEQRAVPQSAAELQESYRHGVGLLELDLTQVSDLSALLGRTVEVESGVGQIKVLVPRELNVAVESHLDAGDISVFGHQASGTDTDLDRPAPRAGAALTLDLHQRLGNIEVVRR